MITVHTRAGDRYTCPRIDHSHQENGITVPCMACRIEVPRVAGRWRAAEDLAHMLDKAAAAAEQLGLALARDLRDHALVLHDIAMKQWREENQRSQIAAPERTARSA